MAKLSYDVKRLHEDCLEWFKAPRFEPWQIECGWVVERTASLKEPCYHIRDEDRQTVASYNLGQKFDNFREIMSIAKVIGLDIEAYRLPEIDRDQAVRDFLATIPEGGELVGEWVKKTEFGGNIAAEISGYPETAIMLCYGGKVSRFAYTFLRIDQREVSNG